MYEEYYDVFRQSPFCRNISMPEYEKFLQAMHPLLRTYSRHAYIVREGDPSAGCFMVLRGEVLQQRENNTGDKTVYEKFCPGEMFGAILLMLPNRDKWNTDFVAITDSTLLFFKKEIIERAQLDSTIFTSRIYQNYVYCVCKQVENLMIALRSLRNTTVRQKISTYIYQMYLFHGNPQLELRLNRTDLAGYLFMPQSSLSREMTNMKKDGIIDYKRDLVKILDLEALKRYAL